VEIEFGLLKLSLVKIEWRKECSNETVMKLKEKRGRRVFIWVGPT